MNWQLFLYYYINLPTQFGDEPFLFHNCYVLVVFRKECSAHSRMHKYATKLQFIIHVGNVGLLNNVNNAEDCAEMMTFVSVSLWRRIKLSYGSLAYILWLPGLHPMACGPTSYGLRNDGLWDAVREETPVSVLLCFLRKRGVKLRKTEENLG